MESATQTHLIDYSPEYKESFKTLNMEWMGQLKVSPSYQLLIQNPEEEIIKKGGFIFFAEADGKIIGTGALLRESNKLYEIATMAVTPAYQGRHIGKALLQKAIDKAKSAGAKQVYLITSTKLKTSIQMYRNFGFVEASFDPEMSIYDGSDIKMVLNLK